MNHCPLALHNLVIQSCIRASYPSGKRKKKSRPTTDLLTSPLFQAIQGSIESLRGTLEEVTKFLRDQINPSDDEILDKLFAPFQRKRCSEGPGQIIHILEDLASDSTEEEHGDRIARALQSWSSIGCLRKILVGQRMEGYPKLSATITGERKYDVYMGIDVFGRGHGYHFSVDGEELSQDPWNNNSLQPVLEYSLDPTAKSIRAIVEAGYGESDPNPKRTIKSTALDVEELADQMELGSKFYVMGYSMEGSQFGASSSTSLIGMDDFKAPFKGITKDVGRNDGIYFLKRSLALYVVYDPASASKKNTVKKVGSINPTEPHSDSRGKSSSTVVKRAQLGRTRSLVQRWEKRETLNNESPTTSGSIDTISKTSTLSHTSFQLTRIERACAMAGLFVLRSMPEPTALALLYGQHQQQTVHDNMGSGSENIAMIFNMGVGYCDVCVTATTGGVSHIKALSEQCVFAARVDVEDISDVILVGGCSNIPKVKSLVLELRKKDEAYMGMDPLEAVVCSGALEGAVASAVSDPLGSLDLLTIQATPQSLGIEADGHTFVPIIPWNMTMPTRKEVWFTTTRDNQTEALIVVYEGEGKKVDENRILDYFKIMGILSAPKGILEISVCID
ncbi:hypothetical protein GIB67_008964 [Kingdonia uniflora]|uniref:Uncharacterized protein n=1 Tax=Kingdonia uniflora TaxID=39325 RepID=A0A7J7LVU1_9MAGN|nr:hypothetical protein GIB67_008964 [Kingdonia uniflora]